MSVDLFGPRPRRKPRVLMPAIDAGLFPDGKEAGHFRCRKCGHDTGWIYATRAELRQGLPCGTCNTAEAAR